MKYIFLAFAVSLVWVQSFGQGSFPIDSSTSKITYSEVITTKGSKADFAVRAKQWAIASKCTTKVDSKAEGKYVAVGQMKVKYPAPMKGFFHDGIVKYKVSVFCKDGKYKYEFTNFVHESNRGNGGALENEIPECGKFTLVLEGWGSIKKQVKTEMPKIIESLKASLAKTPPPPKKNDLDF